MATTSHPIKPRPASKMMPPLAGVIVRMYRIGHGDCFLLVFAGSPAGAGPVHVLIDCGYKPGSPAFINTTAKQVTDDIRQVTGGHIDVMVVTHEHQDHVNGITEANFQGITIGETWFAWTEDPDDDDANELRKRFKDRLQFLIQARNQLGLDASAVDQVGHIDDFLAFELGGDQDEDYSPAKATALLGAAGGVGLSMNKRAMKLVRERAKDVRYLSPHQEALSIPGVEGVRVFPLGPPRDPQLLHSLDPVGAEGFPDSSGFAMGSSGAFLATALSGHLGGSAVGSPFAKRFGVPWHKALADPDSHATAHYGQGTTAPAAATGGDRDTETPASPAWRRIDHDWLRPAADLALDMNNDTNNGSLVLAFELSPGGKVLLFTADAQRGNWISWTKANWKDGARSVTAKDLLSRTVLYKVGHHGSHNATLKGTDASDYANLEWMAAAAHRKEFTAMITAVRPWAAKQKGWDHPLPAIKEELLRKALGRVFQTDTDVGDMVPRGSTAEWAEFLKRVHGEGLYIDYRIDP